MIAAVVIMLLLLPILALIVRIITADNERRNRLK